MGRCPLVTAYAKMLCLSGGACKHFFAGFRGGELCWKVLALLGEDRPWKIKSMSLLFLLIIVLFLRHKNVRQKVIVHFLRRRKKKTKK